jgi:hypothetical protein
MKISYILFYFLIPRIVSCDFINYLSNIIFDNDRIQAVENNRLRLRRVGEGILKFDIN